MLGLAADDAFVDYIFSEPMAGVYFRVEQLLDFLGLFVDVV